MQQNSLFHPVFFFFLFFQTINFIERKSIIVKHPTKHSKLCILKLEYLSVIRKTLWFSLLKFIAKVCFMSACLRYGIIICLRHHKKILFQKKIFIAKRKKIVPYWIKFSCTSEREERRKLSYFYYHYEARKVSFF